MSERWDGLLLWDKAAGPTSHDIVDRVRRATGLRRVGHAGTLDPMASGLLPLVLGRATRLVRFLPHAPKRYEGRLELGWTSRTDDVTGEPVKRHAGKLPDAPQVAIRAREFLGRIHQRPPDFSARKVGGERLYRLARRGAAVEVPPSVVEIFRFEVEPTERPETYGFSVEVAAGTYVRALVRDLGRRLGCGAVLAALRRTAIGPLRPDPRLRFAAESEEPASARLAEALVPLDRMPLALPRQELNDLRQRRRFSSGAAVEAAVSAIPDQGFCAVVGPGGELLGVAQYLGRQLRPCVVLVPEGG